MSIKKDIGPSITYIIPTPLPSERNIVLVDFNKYKPIDSWLETFHINKYVKKYDARVEGRYLTPPEVPKDLVVGDKVMIMPRGRYKFWVLPPLRGKVGTITGFSDQMTKNGRNVTIDLVVGGSVTIREIALKKTSEIFTDPLTSAENMTTDIYEVNNN